MHLFRAYNYQGCLFYCWFEVERNNTKGFTRGEVKIVHSAGFDAVPSDLGTLYLQEEYQNSQTG